MEDFEVRQAFAIIKDRIDDIKKDQDWKEQMAEEWNKTVEMEKAMKEDERSVYSYSKYNQKNFENLFFLLFITLKILMSNYF